MGTAASIFASRFPSPAGKHSEGKESSFDFHYRIKWADPKMRTKSFDARPAPAFGFSKTVHQSRSLAFMDSHSRQVRGLLLSSIFLSFPGWHTISTAGYLRGCDSPSLRDTFIIEDYASNPWVPAIY